MADQVITTRFKTEGAGKVAKDTQTIGKAQTRLGQASASAGRSFSAQANGLGGLVGAYAAAAANIFAITAAFTALSRAAQAEQTIAGLNTLASQFGLVGTEVAESLDRITKGQLNVAEVAQQANLAISAGLGDQLEGLTEVALKASRALGRNLSDSFQRIIRGVGKLEPELLDELGIFTRIEPAVRRYALETGKSASALTNFERRQAFANAALTEGQRKFSAINTTTATSAEKLEKLGATIVNIGLELGGFVAGPLASFAEFITDNASAAVVAIGLLLRQVFGTALGAALSAFDKGTQRLSSSLTALSARAASSQAAFLGLLSTIQTSARAIPAPSRLAGGQAGAPGREVLSRLRRGETISPAEAKTAAAAVDELADAQTRFKKVKEGATQAAEKNQRALRGIANEIRGLENTTTTFGKIYTVTLKGTTFITNIFRASVNLLAAALNRVFIVIALVEGALAILGQIVGKDLSLLAFLAKAFSDANKEARQLAKTGSDLASTFTKDLNELSLTAKQSEEAFKSFSDTVNESLDIGSLGIAIDDVQELFGTVEGTLTNAIVGGIAGAIVFIPDLAFKLGLLLVDGVTEAFALTGLDIFKDLADAFDESVEEYQQAGALRNLRRQFERLQEESKGFGIQARQAFLQIQAFEQLQRFLDTFGIGIIKTFARLEVLTGLTAQNFKELADAGNLVTDSAGNLLFSVNGISIAIADANGNLNEFTEGLDSSLVALAQAGKAFERQFDRGVVTAESAGQAVVQLNNLVKRAEGELTQIRLKNLEGVLVEDVKRLDILKEQLESIKEEIKLVEQLKTDLVVIEAVQKAISSQTSGARKLVEQGSASGIFSAAGGLAGDSTEQLKSRIAFEDGLLAKQQQRLALNENDVNLAKQRRSFLQEEISLNQDKVDSLMIQIASAQEAGGAEERINSLLEQKANLNSLISNAKKDEARLTREIVETDALSASINTVIRDITLGRLGNIVKLRDEISKLNKAEDRRLKSLRDQLSIQEMQNALAAEQRRINIDFVRTSNAVTVTSNQSAEIEKQVALQKAQLATSQRQLDVEKARREEAINRLDAENQLLKIQGQRRLQGIESRLDPAIAAQQSRISDFEAFPNLSSQRQLQEEQARLIALETQKQLEIVFEKERQAREEFERQKEIIQLKSREALKEVSRLQDLQLEQEKSQKLQLEAFDKKAAADKAAAQADINRKVEELLLFEQTERIANTQARIDRERQQFRIDDLRKQAELIKIQAESSDAFLKGQAKLIQDQLKVVNAQRELAGLDPVTISSFQSDVTKTISEADRLLTSLSEQEGILDRTLNQRIANNAAIREDAEALKQLEISAAVEKKRFTEQIANLDRQILQEKFKAETDSNLQAQNAAKEKAIALGEESARLEENFRLTQDKFQKEKTEIIATSNERIKQLNREAASFEQLVNAIAGDLNKGLEDVFTTAFDNLAQGGKVTEGLRDVLVNTFENVRQTVLKKTLIEPAQQFLSEKLGSILGFGGESVGADNAKVTAEGALLVQVVNSTGQNPIADAVKGLSDESETVFNKIGNSVADFGNNVGNTFSGLADEASDLFGQVFKSFSSGGSSGFGDILGGLFGSSSAGPAVAASAVPAPSPTFMGIASGGLVHMASGGMMRDRVPALLEPGEFVMKRSAARGIGTPALNQMNATGSAGGNVVVNIKNEGTPQEATASQPVFDGEKFVVDIVTRDLRNNGPIRKSLRGGS